ncbi:MAG: RNA methyltransferase [Clostridiales bacterium]|jgi:TrmH family RNA methyltransferase|nr:RNA methyltransferase [Clostridiales bacterium]
MKYITSSENGRYKELKKLSARSYRRAEAGLFLAEGERIAADALECGAAEYFVIDEGYGEADAAALEARAEVYRFSDKLFHAVSDTKTTQGIIAVCRVRTDGADGIDHLRGLLVICDGVSDPGNLGTILRTAECAGAAGVLLLDGCADRYNPKSVRATMGSIFRVPVYLCEVGALARLTAHEIIAAALDNAEPLYDTRFGENTAILIGSEARGVSKEAAAYAARRVTIPMRGGAESLNAAVAAGLMMYEVRRQNR